MIAANKKVPWAQLEKYLGVHQVAIVTFVDQQKHNYIEVADVEARLPKSFLHLHEVITKILKDNDILPNDEESKVDHLELILKTVMKLQS